MNRQELADKIDAYATARTTGNVNLIQLSAVQLNEALNVLYPPPQKPEEPTTE